MHTTDILPEDGEAPSLFTLVGMAETEILQLLERQGRMTLHRLVQALEWPSGVIVMAAGVLIREQRVQGRQRDFEVILERLA